MANSGISYHLLQAEDQPEKTNEDGGLEQRNIKPDSKSPAQQKSSQKYVPQSILKESHVDFSLDFPGIDLVIHNAPPYSM